MYNDNETYLRGKIAVIIPAYNEEKVIYDNICSVVSLFDKLGYCYEIVVIDDGSKDNTHKEALRAAGELKEVIVLRNDTNMGKGWAIRKGFVHCQADLVAFLDADFELDPLQINKFLELMKREKSDVVIGSKWHPDSKVNYPFRRRIISLVYFGIVKFLFKLPIRDTQTGLKIFKYKVLKEAMERSTIKEFALDLELLVVIDTLGYKISESPVFIQYKRLKEKIGRITAASIYKVWNDTLAVYYRKYFLKYYDYARLPIEDESPLVSVIITTTKNNDYLQECIRYCSKLNYPDFEIIVVPDQKYEEKNKNVKIIPSGHKKPADKRDLAVSYAKGEIIAFLDDDTYPATDWLRNAIKNFDRKNISAVVGPGITPESSNNRQKASGIVFSSYIIGGGQAAYRYKSKIHRYVDDYPTCNFIMWKKDFLKVGGFDTTYWPGEDTVLSLKIIKDLGKKILYAPDVIVYHHRRPLFKAHLRQISGYALHRGYFVKKFPHTSFKISYFMPTLFLAFLILGAILSSYQNWMWEFYRTIAAIYLGLVVITAIKPTPFISPHSPLYKRGVRGDCKGFGGIVKLFFLIAGGIISTHFVYGIYFVKGLLANKMPEE